MDDNSISVTGLNLLIFIIEIYCCIKTTIFNNDYIFRPIFSIKTQTKACPIKKSERKQLTIKQLNHKNNL